jgi:hypothetical protein
MKQEDIDKAIMAYRYSCPDGTLLKYLDGTKEPHSCWEFNSKKHGYKCNGYMCKRLRKFVNILKEPTQDSLPDFSLS